MNFSPENGKNVFPSNPYSIVKSDTEVQLSEIFSLISSNDMLKSTAPVIVSDTGTFLFPNEISSTEILGEIVSITLTV